MSGDVELQPKQWHLDRSVSLTHIISTVVLAGSLFGAYNSLTNRLTVLEAASSQYNGAIIQLLNNQALVDKRQDATIDRITQQQREDQRDILAKLERMNDFLRNPPAPPSYRGPAQ